MVGNLNYVPIGGTLNSPPNFLMQSNDEVVSYDGSTEQLHPTGIMLENVVKTFVWEDMIYLAMASGELQNCSLQYTNCQAFTNLQTSLCNDSSKQLLSFQKHNHRAFISLLDNNKLQLIVKSHRSGATRTMSMPAS